MTLAIFGIKTESTEKDRAEEKTRAFITKD
jgi:hypothetical protein